jgi:tetratricopeptide (TPR) repeat protein
MDWRVREYTRLTFLTCYSRWVLYCKFWTRIRLQITSRELQARSVSDKDYILSSARLILGGILLSIGNQRDGGQRDFMRVRLFSLFTALILTAVLLGCSSIARWEFSLARRVDERGKKQAACRLYQGALQRMPEGDRQSRSQAYYRLGECLWSLGRPTEALEDFQNAVDLDDGNALARLRLGEILLASGAVDRATEQALAVLEGGSGNPEALALLGAASSGAGHTEIAAAAFKKVLDAEPARVNVAIALADIYNREDRVEDARGVLKKVSQMQPNSASPLLALARLEEQEGNVAAAERAYRDAVLREDTPPTNLRLAQFLERSSRVDEAQTVLRRVDHQQPLSPTALPDFQLLAGKPGDALEQYFAAMHSRALQAHDDLNETAAEAVGARAALAARIIEADLEMAQGSVEPLKAVQVAHLHLAEFRKDLDAATVAVLQTEMALAEGDMTAAEVQGKAAVELAPNSAASHYVNGIVRYRAGQIAEARSAWTEAIEHDGDFVPARLALAREFLQVGDVRSAEEYVLPAVRDEPGNLRALNLYARVLLAQNRLSAALVISNRALSIDSNTAAPRLLLAAIAERRHQYAAALMQFERAVLLDPRSEEAIEGLVRLYRRGEITRPMLLKMEKSALARPESAPLMEIAGRLYAEHGWYPDAVRCLQRALSLDPQRGSAAAALAQILAGRGESDAAVRLAERVGGKTAALLAGLTAQQRNNITEAIVQYEVALRNGERSGVAANNLAWLYAQEGTSLDRALILAEQARALAPKNPAILDTVGVVRLRRREYTDAISALSDAAVLAAMPGLVSQPKLAAVIRKHLSEAYLRAGMPEQAATARIAAPRDLARRLMFPAITRNSDSE